MADGGFSDSMGQLDGSVLEQDFISLHNPDSTRNIRHPPNTLLYELNDSSSRSRHTTVSHQIAPRPELNSTQTITQTSRVRSNSDSSGSHSPTAEDSPLGSPNTKYEELVSSLESKGHCRSDRRYMRDQFDITTYEGRLATYVRWQHPYLSKEVLAWAGFYYTGESDRVCCAKCFEEIFNWEPGDDPRQEHQTLFGYGCF